MDDTAAKGARYQRAPSPIHSTDELTYACAAKDGMICVLPIFYFVA